MNDNALSMITLSSAGRRRGRSNVQGLLLLWLSPENLGRTSGLRLRERSSELSLHGLWRDRSLSILMPRVTPIFEIQLRPP